MRTEVNRLTAKGYVLTKENVPKCERKWPKSLIDGRAFTFNIQEKTSGFSMHEKPLITLTTAAKMEELRRQYSAYGTTFCPDVLLANFEPFNTFLIMACSHFYETFLSSSSGSSCKRGMAFTTLHSDPHCLKMTQKVSFCNICQRSKQILFSRNWTLIAPKSNNSLAIL